MSEVKFLTKLLNGEEVRVIAEVGRSIEIESVYPVGMDDPEDILGDLSRDDLDRLEIEAVEEWRDLELRAEPECMDYDKLSGGAA